MVEASFPYRTMRDRIELTRTHDGRVAITASRDGGTQTISVHLSPEDILQFAQDALHLADEIAEREIS